MNVTVALPQGEFQKLPPLFASGQVSIANSCEDGTYDERAKGTERRLCSHR